MPSPALLDMPPGNAAALEELVQDVAGAAFWLATLGERLTGPAAAAPGWLGDDASAAADQVGAVAVLARDCSEAVLTAAGRLSAHAALLRAAHQQVAALRAEQREDFRAAWVRISQIENYRLVVMVDGSEGMAVVEDVEAAEAARLRRHASLLEEVEDHAAGTARVLAESCAVVGGRGTPGDAGRVVAQLAADLPGWGDLELAGRGTAVADVLVGGPVTPEEMEEAARDAAAYAGSSAFAEAFLAGLGEEGVAYLLTSLGYNTLGPVNSVARLLAAAFGAAVPRGRTEGPVGEVLGGVYVRSDDRDGVSGTIAAGMATVLAAGATVPSGGLRMSTVAEWSRQLLLREQEQGMPAGVVPYGWGPELGDPTVLAIGILADGGEPAPSAALLSDARVWEGLLGRSWGDGGAALREVIALAGSESGPVGDHVVRTGLAVVGGGVSEGDPSGWTVNRHTVAAVAPALGAAVTGHLSVATYALGSIADGEVGERNGDILRGLGYLTVDREAATAITGALHRWASAQPVDLQETGPLSPLPVVAVPSAFLAVRQYGQRLAYALHGFEQQEASESREWWWNLVIGLPVSFIPGPLGVGVGVGEGYAAILFGADGTWDNGADRGPVFDREDAAEAAADGPAAADATTADAVARQARATYDRAIRALGLPEPPESPETDYLAPLVDGLIDHMGDRLGRTPRAPR